jgi:Flp pilus assembly pilin Flp
MPTSIRSFLRDDSGEDLIEYGLLASFVAAVALAAIIADPVGLRTAVSFAFRKCQGALTQMTNN